MKNFILFDDSGKGHEIDFGKTGLLSLRDDLSEIRIHNFGEELRVFKYSDKDNYLRQKERFDKAGRKEFMDTLIESKQ